jgi:ethanolamine ammonia-lyase small subunit
MSLEPLAPAQAGLAANRGGDPWQRLRRHTPARIALGRAGGSLRTDSLLDFRLAHARARDAVQARFAPDGIEHALRGTGLEVVRLSTAAHDRASYLARPELGRRLSPEDGERLRSLATLWGRRDLVIIISDGLSAPAAETHAVETAATLAAEMGAAGWTLYPLLLVPFARVKLQDEVGQLLSARHSLILLGERPGLSAPDSLGAYLTLDPGPTRTDADRNCVSNIRPDGLPPRAAAARIASLLRASRRLGLSGIRLKESGGLLLDPGYAVGRESGAAGITSGASGPRPGARS